ncbi:MAG: hypothetical protein ACLUDU_04310 [Butyricimonas faecihominis]
MGFARDFSRGIRAYGKAISLLFSSKLWYFMLFPVVIVIVLFVAGNYAVGYLGDGLSGVIEAKMTEWIEGISWLEWVSGVAGFLVKLLTRFLYYILFRWGIRGNGGDVTRLLVAFRTDRGNRVGTGVSV